MDSNSDIQKLEDVWYLMRIHQLGSFFNQEEYPPSSWIMDLVFRLFQSSYRSKYSELFSTPKDRILSRIEKTLGNVRFEIDKSELHDILRKIDQDTGTIVTAHWLTYIFDVQEKADFIWAKFPLFFSLATKLNSRSADPNQLKKTYAKERIVWDPITGMELKHRFYAAKEDKAPEKKLHLKLKENMERTIDNLVPYGSIPKYIAYMFPNAKTDLEEDWLRLVAAALFWLTYYNSDKFSKEPDRSKLREFALKTGFVEDSKQLSDKESKKVRFTHFKRLWAALRDYTMDPYYRRLFIAGMPRNNTIRKHMEKLDSDPMRYETYLAQLELPGDVWNERLVDKILCGNLQRKLKDEGFGNIVGKGLKSSIAARRLYRYITKDITKGEVQEESIKKQLYPVYLDASFKIREENLGQLIDRSSEIRQTIQGKYGPLKNRESVVQAFETLRKCCATKQTCVPE